MADSGFCFAGPVRSGATPAKQPLTNRRNKFTVIWRHDDEETKKNRARITICVPCFACIRLLVFHASEPVGWGE
jgi:hypothetical protein